ncbi:hypothetical protein Tco_0824477 [Tanacetum coccineum]|uniref:Uncharacterized protein n=1 Tax=Tanacetum coccineum TaxID=301880 RepID=A0ABQ5ALT4_9ASTR
MNKEILQAREDLMETIKAFLKEYDHIPPEQKCMALLLAKERFLKIKQVMEEEQNQPEVMQELLLKLIDDLQILKGIQQEKEKLAAQITPKVILIAWESFGEIKHALTDKQYRQEDIQELMSKLLEDVQNINEELSEYINCPSWNRPTFYDNDDEYTVIYRKPKAITPDLPIEEPDNSLIMGDEHLDTIPETESDEIIKSSVEILVPIPSEFEGTSDDACDVPICEDPSTFDALNDHSEILSDSNDDGTSSDDDDFEDIEYVDASPPDSELVSLEEVNDIDQEEKEFDLEDILQIQDVILREKFLNISRLITNIESLKENPTPDRVLKSPSLFPIPVTDSDSFFEESDTSLSHLDNSLPEFETFSDHIEETRSGSTTTHTNNSLPDPSWNRPTFYNDNDEYTVIYRKHKEITPDLPIEEPDNSLSMGDEHLNTIPETEKSSVENLVPIPSEFKGISEDICDVPSCDYFDAECGLINSLLSRDSSITSPKIDFLLEEFVGELNFINLILPGIDEDNFDEDNFDEDDFDEEEGENENDILQIEDEILREKLVNVNLLIDKIKALKLTPSIPFVLENPSSSPIPVVDSEFLIEEVDTFLVPEDSIPPGIESDLDLEGDIVFLDGLTT